MAAVDRPMEEVVDGIKRKLGQKRRGIRGIRNKVSVRNG